MVATSDDAIWSLSNLICGAAGRIGLCNCPGDNNGADPDRALCWRLARAMQEEQELATGKVVDISSLATLSGGQT